MPTMQTNTTHLPTTAPAPRPTRRELDIMRLAMHGYTTKAIAAELFIEQGTVEVHRSNIIRKLRCGNFTAAVVMALREKWLEY